MRAKDNYLEQLNRLEERFAMICYIIVINRCYNDNVTIQEYMGTNTTTALTPNRHYSLPTVKTFIGGEHDDWVLFGRWLG